MTAISEELIARGRPRPNRDDDGPEVSVVEGPAGRETLALIEDLARPMRPPQATVDYGDRISNAPGSKTPSHAPVAPKAAQPENAKPKNAKPESPKPKAARPESAKPDSAKPDSAKPDSAKPDSAKPDSAKPDSAKPESAPLTIFEMLTFVVQGADAASLASQEQRRGFVKSHLRQRLPAKDMTRIERIDVTPWPGQDALVVRVWCKL
jgi:cell division septation protein DedD